MNAQEFEWTAGLDVSFPAGAILWPSVTDDLSDQLVNRGAAFARRRDTPRMSVWMGAKGASAEEAGEEARVALQDSCNFLGMHWMDVTVKWVESNRFIDAEIARIDTETGIMRPEAEVIQLFRQD